MALTRSQERLLENVWGGVQVVVGVGGMSLVLGAVLAGLLTVTIRSFGYERPAELKKRVAKLELKAAELQLKVGWSDRTAVSDAQRKRSAASLEEVVRSLEEARRLRPLPARWDDGLTYVAYGLPPVLFLLWGLLAWQCDRVPKAGEEERWPRPVALATPAPVANRAAEVRSPQLPENFALPPEVVEVHVSPRRFDEAESRRLVLPEAVPCAPEVAAEVPRSEGGAAVKGPPADAPVPQTALPPPAPVLTGHISPRYLTLGESGRPVAETESSSVLKLSARVVRQDGEVTVVELPPGVKVEPPPVVSVELPWVPGTPALPKWPRRVRRAPSDDEEVGDYAPVRLSPLQWFNSDDAGGLLAHAVPRIPRQHTTLVLAELAEELWSQLGQAVSSEKPGRCLGAARAWCFGAATLEEVEAACDPVRAMSPQELRWEWQAMRSSRVIARCAAYVGDGAEDEVSADDAIRLVDSMAVILAEADPRAKATALAAEFARDTDCAATRAYEPGAAGISEGVERRLALHHLWRLAERVRELIPYPARVSRHWLVRSPGRAEAGEAILRIDGRRIVEAWRRTKTPAMPRAMLN